MRFARKRAFYRKKLTSEHIIHEIETNKGKQFDPEVADVMLKLVREGQIVMDENEFGNEETDQRRS